MRMPAVFSSRHSHAHGARFDGLVEVEKVGEGPREVELEAGERLQKLPVVLSRRAGVTILWSCVYVDFGRAASAVQEHERVDLHGLGPGEPEDAGVVLRDIRQIVISGLEVAPAVVESVVLSVVQPVRALRVLVGVCLCETSEAQPALGHEKDRVYPSALVRVERLGGVCVPHGAGLRAFGEHPKNESGHTGFRNLAVLEEMLAGDPLALVVHVAWILCSRFEEADAVVGGTQDRADGNFLLEGISEMLGELLGVAPAEMFAVGRAVVSVSAPENLVRIGQPLLRLRTVRPHGAGVAVDVLVRNPRVGELSRIDGERRLGDKRERHRRHLLHNMLLLVRFYHADIIP